MRFFAAALVVISHCGLGAIGRTPLEGFFSNGYESVSFFFILSGFILAYVYDDLLTAGHLSYPSLRAFWIRRFLRIYPTYILALAISLPPFVYYDRFGAGALPTPVFLSGLFLAPILLQAWVPGLALIWTLPAWSLSVEALFYLCFPFLGRFFRSLNVIRGVVATGLFASFFGLALTLATPGVYTTYSIPMQDLVLYFPLVHIPKFIFGIALGRAFLRYPDHWRKSGDFWLAGAAVGVILIFGYRFRLDRWVFSDAVLAPLFGIVIYAAASARGFISRILSHPWFVELGDASYGLYILHLPIYFWWVRFGPGRIHDLNRIGEIYRSLLYFLIITMISIWTHHLLEPWRRRWLSKALRPVHGKEY